MPGPESGTTGHLFQLTGSRVIEIARRDNVLVWERAGKNAESSGHWQWGTSRALLQCDYGTLISEKVHEKIHRWLTQYLSMLFSQRQCHWTYHETFEFRHFATPHAPAGNFHEPQSMDMLSGGWEKEKNVNSMQRRGYRGVRVVVMARFHNWHDVVRYANRPFSTT